MKKEKNGIQLMAGKLNRTSIYNDFRSLDFPAKIASKILISVLPFKVDVRSCMMTSPRDRNNKLGVTVPSETQPFPYT